MKTRTALLILLFLVIIESKMHYSPIAFWLIDHEFYGRDLFAVIKEAIGNIIIVLAAALLMYPEKKRA